MIRKIFNSLKIVRVYMKFGEDSMKKIIVGSIQQESNSLTSVKSTIEDFSFFKGSDMLNKITPISFLNKKDFLSYQRSMHMLLLGGL